MADTSKGTGGVVILGVQGSGKTVFLSVLGETFAEGGVFGLSLAGDPATEDFTAETFRLMEWERQFPESTDRTVAVPLHWTVHAGERELFSLSTLDCAGELIVDAFAPGAERREALENGLDPQAARWPWTGYAKWCATQRWSVFSSTQTTSSKTNVWMAQGSNVTRLSAVTATWTGCSTFFSAAMRLVHAPSSSSSRRRVPNRFAVKSPTTAAPEAIFSIPIGNCESCRGRLRRM